MVTRIKIDPVTRIEGHLDVEVTVEYGKVVNAYTSGTMFRGFENILVGRDPRDATILTQRICGVCPISHAMAATRNLESAFGVSPPDNGRILRNLVLGANFIMSHILHFYHLSAVDYIDLTAVLPMSPWQPQYLSEDMVSGDLAQTLVNHYVEALAVRRKAHQMAAIFGAKLPCASTFVPGGCTEVVTANKVKAFRALLSALRDFIDTVYIPDILTVAAAFPHYLSVGSGCGNLLAYGVFDLDASGGSKLLARGRYADGALGEVDPSQIAEYVGYARYTAESGGLNPSEGITAPDVDKPGAYSWLKAPRYENTVYETGPLARMIVNYLQGDPTVVKLIDQVLGELEADPEDLFSVLGRHAARALECKFIADSMVGWLAELEEGEAVYAYSPIPRSAFGMGLTEAPRGALGHWIQIDEARIARYQVITPTAWNASPRDDEGQLGPIEQALIGTPVANTDQPVEVLRVVHAFDPCIACAVHLVSPGDQSLAKFRVS